jgi:hypothetical protein
LALTVFVSLRPQVENPIDYDECEEDSFNTINLLEGLADGWLMQLDIILCAIVTDRSIAVRPLVR